jgi:hypothetical protein
MDKDLEERLQEIETQFWRLNGSMPFIKETLQRLDKSIAEVFGLIQDKFNAHDKRAEERWNRVLYPALRQISENKATLKLVAGALIALALKIILS